MDINNNNTFVDGEKHDSIAEQCSPHDERLRKWFDEYMAIEANTLVIKHDILKDLDLDELENDFIERKIRDSPLNPILGRFCTKCQDLFDHWPTLGGSSTREHNSQPIREGGNECTSVQPCSTFELEVATRAGCKFCAFLLQTLKDRMLLDLFRKIETRSYHLGDNSKSFLSIQNFGTNPSQLLWLNLPGKNCNNVNKGIAPHVRFDSAFLPESADCYDQSPEILSTANNWLSDCIENHEACASNNCGTLPTRLLSVVGDPPRLVFTANYPNRPRYVALSHSWGSHKSIKLTSENMGSLMQGISIDMLPKTFQDAITITRRLDIDFLWIDSLCIIQNDDNDWQKESALMGTVYGGSVVTIAASSAHNASEGCFLKPPNFNGGLRARITDGGRKRVQDFVRYEEYDRSTINTHLATRAWALQEKMLLSRTIHFSDRGALWECRTSIASEFFPDGFSQTCFSSLVCGRGKFDYNWRRIVILYSAANLTYAKDKLQALSGIAGKGHDEHGDQYLAGIWRKQIEDQVCWRLRGSHPSKRPLWRAPTWSWASVDGKVSWDEIQFNGRYSHRDTMYAHVVDANTTPYDCDPFGQVKDGFIRLACSTMAVGNILDLDISNGSEPGENTVTRIAIGDQEKIFPTQLDCLDDISKTHNNSIYLVPLYGGGTGFFSRMVKEEESIEELMFQGLVLQDTKTG